VPPRAFRLALLRGGRAREHRQSKSADKGKTSRKRAGTNEKASGQMQGKPPAITGIGQI